MEPDGGLASGAKGCASFSCLFRLGLTRVSRVHRPSRGRWHAPSSRHLRALLSVCGEVFVWGSGVFFLSCVCVCVSGMLFLCRCVCVCDLLIFLQMELDGGRASGAKVAPPCRFFFCCPALTLSCPCVYLCVQRNRLAWPHRRRGLASDGVRYAGARSSVGRRFRSATKLRLEWYGGVFLLLQQRSKHPREMVITPKASTSLVFCS